MLQIAVVKMDCIKCLCTLLFLVISLGTSLLLTEGSPVSQVPTNPGYYQSMPPPAILRPLFPSRPSGYSSAQADGVNHGNYMKMPFNWFFPGGARVSRGMPQKTDFLIPDESLDQEMRNEGFKRVDGSYAQQSDDADELLLAGQNKLSARNSNKNKPLYSFFKLMG